MSGLNNIEKNSYQNNNEIKEAQKILAGFKREAKEEVASLIIESKLKNLDKKSQQSPSILPPKSKLTPVKHMHTEKTPERTQRIEQILTSLNGTEFEPIIPDIQEILQKSYKNGEGMKKGIKGFLESHYGSGRGLWRKKRHTMKDILPKNRRKLLDEQAGLNQLAPSNKEIRTNKKLAKYLEKDQLAKINKEIVLLQRIQKSSEYATMGEMIQKELEHRIQRLNGVVQASKDHTINTYPHTYTPSNQSKWLTLSGLCHKKMGHPCIEDLSPTPSTGSSIKKYPPIGGLLKNIDSMTDIQKRRIGNMGQMAGYALTAWALYKTFFSKKPEGKGRAKFILGATGLSMLASYATVGRLKGLPTMIEGALTGGEGGCIVKKFLKMVGLEDTVADLFGKDVPEGAEQAAIGGGIVANILPTTMTYKSFMDQYCEKSNNNTITLTKDTNGTPKLAHYYLNQTPPQKDKAQQVINIAEAGSFEQGLIYLQIKDDLLERKDENIDITKMIPLQKQLNSHLEKHNLKVDNFDAINKYMSGEYTWNELLNTPGVFSSKEKASVATTIQRYDSDHIRMLSRLPDTHPAIAALPIESIISYATFNGMGYDINRNDIAENVADTGIKSELKNSSTKHKAKRTMLVNEIIALQTDDPQSLKNSTQTLKDIITQKAVGIGLLTYGLDQLNNKSLIVKHDAFHMLQQKMLAAHTQADVDNIIQGAIADKTITFDIHSNPLLENVSAGFASKLSTLDSLKADLPTKLEILAWTESIENRTQDKLPSPLSLSVTADGSGVTLESYGQMSTFRIDKSKGTYTLHHSTMALDPDEKLTTTSQEIPVKTTSIGEALQLAQLTNLSTGMMRYGSADVNPRRRQDKELQFSKQDSLLEWTKDVYSTGFSKKAFLSWMDTDVASKDAIATYYPSLAKPSQGAKYAQWLNSMKNTKEESLRHRESDPSKIRTLTNTVNTTLASINNGIPGGKGFEIKEQSGHIVKVGFEDPSMGDMTITIDMMDNQILGGLSPLIAPGSLESATRLATHLLLTGQYIANLYGKGKVLTAVQLTALSARWTTSPLGKAIKATIDGLQGVGTATIGLVGNLAGLANNVINFLSMIIGIPAGTTKLPSLPNHPIINQIKNDISKAVDYNIQTAGMVGTAIGKAYKRAAKWGLEGSEWLYQFAGGAPDPMKIQKIKSQTHKKIFEKTINDVTTLSQVDNTLKLYQIIVPEIQSTEQNAIKKTLGVKIVALISTDILGAKKQADIDNINKIITKYKQYIEEKDQDILQKSIADKIKEITKK